MTFSIAFMPTRTGNQHITTFPSSYHSWSENFICCARVFNYNSEMLCWTPKDAENYSGKSIFWRKNWWRTVTPKLISPRPRWFGPSDEKGCGPGQKISGYGSSTTSYEEAQEIMEKWTDGAALKKKKKKKTNIHDDNQHHHLHI